MRELLGRDLASAIEPAAELGDPLAIDVEGDHGEMTGEIDGERQPDITEPDNADPHEGESGEARRSFPLLRNDVGGLFLQGRPRVRGLRGAPALLALGNREVQAPGKAASITDFRHDWVPGKAAIGLFDGEMNAT